LIVDNFYSLIRMARSASNDVLEDMKALNDHSFSQASDAHDEIDFLKQLNRPCIPMLSRVESANTLVIPSDGQNTVFPPSTVFIDFEGNQRDPDQAHSRVEKLIDLTNQLRLPCPL